jgi:hypothetical protein
MAKKASTVLVMVILVGIMNLKSEWICMEEELECLTAIEY